MAGRQGDHPLFGEDVRAGRRGVGDGEPDERRVRLPFVQGTEGFGGTRDGMAYDLDGGGVREQVYSGPAVPAGTSHPRSREPAVPPAVRAGCAHGFDCGVVVAAHAAVADDVV
ncbi:hypothetical protein ADL34_30845 [Streptomyces sp. NRRL WC-3605]|nr:hypothetical protein ADL33_31560 [Streptomyces sp. NRRL WC-3604]KUL69351.1 hypothetical protein ADL34_30845 [Streptomyces sp. NRRL WC-3605]